MAAEDSNLKIATPAAEAARQVSRAGARLVRRSGGDRARALQCMADRLERCQEDVLEANTLDLELSRERAISETAVEWLKLTPERLQGSVRILEHLAAMADPVGRVTGAKSAGHPARAYGQWWPLGTIAFACEAFPELVAIAAGMCLKTANGLLIEGSGDARQTNAAIVRILQDALRDAELPAEMLHLLGENDDLPARSPHSDVNLAIAYGRNAWVQKIASQSSVPVIKASLGNCYLYWSAAGSLDLARWMILDSHASTPDPTNAIEKVLVDVDRKASSLTTLWSDLHEKGFEIRADEALLERFPELQVASTEEWGQPYLNKTIAFKQVENIEFAMAWIDRYGSRHMSCLATESYEESRRFSTHIKSACTYINASPRFERLSRDGATVFLGMSESGFIGLESLMRVKQVIQGWEA